MPIDPEVHQPLSRILRDISEQADPRVSVGDLMERFDGRAMGALLLVFGLACILPLPPGGTTIFGAPLVLLAPQLMIGGSRAPWLPARMRAQTIATADLRRGLPRVLGALEWVEAVSRPRLPILFGTWGHRVIGLVCTVLALVLILPIPLGNILPAASVSMLSLALVQRDGLMALLGYGLAGLSGGVLVLAAGLILRAINELLEVLPIA
ncbi:exopolysaccharide biosynthesis protein [Phenylobacterium sp.]|uniref:exopolysaccharide biosynthesis protein n=1 Tax=Phenylobacterium sp. TaxID=1871053 RepID=UPI00286AB721|nr:exopolysaccharide biosynthesis protein [Phenylobacterium sp.]